MSSTFLTRRMDAQPVTLQVRIYDQTYNIRYPSNRRIRNLQFEFATLCKGRLKPGSNRRFFICIHCGRNDFSNKMRLNQHRYEVGCKQVKYADGCPALLLPYPDFKPGQGKLVECMAKAVRCCPTQFPREGDDGDEGHGSKHQDCDNTRGILGVPASGKLEYNIPVEGCCSSRRVLLPPTDLFFGPAPPRPGREVPRRRPHRHQQAMAAAAPGTKVEDKGEEGGLQQLKGRSSQRLPASKVTTRATAGNGIKKRFRRLQGAAAELNDTILRFKTDDHNAVHTAPVVDMQVEDVTPLSSCDTTGDEDDDRHQGTTASVWSSTISVIAPELAAKTLKEVYLEMEIDRLLEQVPGRGKGAVRKKRVIFYNQYRKEVPVNWPAIRGLKRTKTCLAGGIVDFVLSRLLLQQPEGIQREVHIISSTAVAAIGEGFHGSDEALQGFLESHLRAMSPTTTDEVKVLLVPWLHAGHWSLLVFWRDWIFHLDSASGELHFPTTMHSSFVHSISQAWQHARGVREYLVERVSLVEVLQQTSPAESGQHVLRNIELYLKFRASEEVDRERNVRSHLLNTFRAMDVNVNILALLSQELDLHRRDTRYRPPFCPMKERRF